MNELNFRSFEEKRRGADSSEMPGESVDEKPRYLLFIANKATRPTSSRELMDHRRQGFHCEIVADRRTSKLPDRKGDDKTGARSSGCRVIRNGRERNGIRVKLITASVGVG
jgi:hypothetical protein